MKTKEELAIEFVKYTVSLMDVDSLRQIAEINLLANLDSESDLATWEDYVAQMPSKHTVEDLLALIQPSVNMVANNNEG